MIWFTSTITFSAFAWRMGSIDTWPCLKSGVDSEASAVGPTQALSATSMRTGRASARKPRSRRRRKKQSVKPDLQVNATVRPLHSTRQRSGWNTCMVTSNQLNGMSESQLRVYRLLIVPSGNFEQIGIGLTSSTTASVRNAVDSGLNYMGICAGAFFAGNSPYNGLNPQGGWLARGPNPERPKPHNRLQHLRSERRGRTLIRPRRKGDWAERPWLWRRCVLSRSRWEFCFGRRVPAG